MIRHRVSGRLPGATTSRAPRRSLRQVLTALTAAAVVAGARPARGGPRAGCGDRVDQRVGDERRGEPLAATLSLSPSAGGRGFDGHDRRRRDASRSPASRPGSTTCAPPTPRASTCTTPRSGTARRAPRSTSTSPIADGAALTGVDLVLADATGIRVLVTDEAGNPLPNIQYGLDVYRPEEGDWYGLQRGPNLTRRDRAHVGEHRRRVHVPAVLQRRLLPGRLSTSRRSATVTRASAEAPPSTTPRRSPSPSRRAGRRPRSPCPSSGSRCARSSRSSPGPPPSAAP